MPDTAARRKKVSPQDSTGAPENGSHKKMPVTVMIPEIVDRNLAVYCAITRTSKSQFVAEVIEQALRENHGMDPFAEPKIIY
jgi:hypothetical protein